MVYANARDCEIYGAELHIAQVYTVCTDLIFLFLLEIFSIKYCLKLPACLKRLVTNEVFSKNKQKAKSIMFCHYLIVII